MTDYHEYIGALRKCAKEHENDRTSTGQIIVSNLCEVIADLLEELSSSEKPNKSIEEKCPCYYCEHFEIKGLSHCKIHEDAYGDSRCNDYHKINQKPNKSEIPTGSATKNDLPRCQCADTEITKSFIEDVEAVKDQLPCGEQMDFPNTFDEFVKDYGFRDKQEVYTNGSELIQVFRVKQWLEHISTTKNDLGVDCISRQELLKIYEDRFSELQKLKHLKDNKGAEDRQMGVNYCINILKELPPVTPQEPRWILCSERLPKDKETVLVTFKHHISGKTIGLGSVVVLRGKPHWHVREQNLGTYDVIAWMPLPTSYETAESEDKE